MKNLFTILAIALTFQCVGQDEDITWYENEYRNPEIKNVDSIVSMMDSLFHLDELSVGCNDTIILTEHTTININCDYKEGTIVIYGNGYQLTIKSGSNKVLFRNGDTDLYPTRETELSHFTVDNETLITIGYRRRVSDGEYMIGIYKWLTERHYKQ